MVLGVRGRACRRAATPDMKFGRRNQRRGGRTAGPETRGRRAGGRTGGSRAHGLGMEGAGGPRLNGELPHIRHHMGYPYSWISSQIDVHKDVVHHAPGWRQQRRPNPVGRPAGRRGREALLRSPPLRPCARRVRLFRAPRRQDLVGRERIGARPAQRRRPPRDRPAQRGAGRRPRAVRAAGVLDWCRAASRTANLCRQPGPPAGELAGRGVLGRAVEGLGLSRNPAARPFLNPGLR